MNWRRHAPKPSTLHSANEGNGGRALAGATRPIQWSAPRSTSKRTPDTPYRVSGTTCGAYTRRAAHNTTL